MKQGINFRLLSNRRRKGKKGEKGKRPGEGEREEEGEGPKGKGRRETTVALQFIFSLST